MEEVCKMPVRFQVRRYLVALSTDLHLFTSTSLSLVLHSGALFGITCRVAGICRSCSSTAGYANLVKGIFDTDSHCLICKLHNAKGPGVDFQCLTLTGGDHCDQ